MAHISWLRARQLLLRPGWPLPTGSTFTQLQALGASGATACQWSCAEGLHIWASCAPHSQTKEHTWNTTVCTVTSTARLDYKALQLSKLSENSFNPVYTVVVYFCDMTTGNGRTNQIRDAPAQQFQFVMFSSAHIRACQQCTFVILHNSRAVWELSISLAGLPPPGPRIIHSAFLRLTISSFNPNQ